MSWLALVFTIIGFGCSYALGHAGEALDEAFAQFTREIYGREAGGWHGTTFKAAAHRVSSLGPEYAEASDEAIHGGLSLPLKDREAAHVVAEVYAEKTLERLRTDDRTGYWALRRWLPDESSVEIDALDLPQEETALTADPGAQKFVSGAIEASLAVARAAVSWEIADYVEIRQFKLWLPALIIWLLLFLLICSTAIRRIERQSLNLK